MLYEIEDQICAEQANWSFAFRARTRVRRFFNQVTKLQARVNTLLESVALQQDSAAVVTTILREIKTLDMSIDGWSETLERWQPIPIIDKPPDHAFADILAVHSYTSLTVFLHHIMKFVAQIRLHECALRLLEA